MRFLLLAFLLSSCANRQWQVVESYASDLPDRHRVYGCMTPAAKRELVLADARLVCAVDQHNGTSVSSACICAGSTSVDWLQTCSAWMR